VKRKTVDRQPDEFFKDEPKFDNIPLKGKALRKFSRREDDDYY
jgi:hypothetical protein